MPDWDDRQVQRARDRGYSSGYSTREHEREVPKETPEQAAAKRVDHLWHEAAAAAMRAKKLSAIAWRKDWHAERDDLKAKHQTLLEELKSRAIDAKVSEQVQARYDEAAAKVGVIAEDLEHAREPRPMPPVRDEVAIEPSIKDRSAVPGHVLAWVAGLSARERTAIAERLGRVGGGAVDRADGFAVALSNYFGDPNVRSTYPGLRTKFLNVAKNPGHWVTQEQAPGAPAPSSAHVAPRSEDAAVPTPNSLVRVPSSPVPGSAHTSVLAASSGHAPVSASSSPAHHAIGRAIDLARLGVAHLGAIEATLVPAYRRAVAAMDTAAVKAIALQIVGGVARIVDAQAQVVRLVPQVDPGPHAAMASTSATDPGTPDVAELATLTSSKAALDAGVLATVPKLAVEVSPQWFGAELVAGRAPEPPPHVREVLVQLAYEAGLVVQLLEEADVIEALIRPVDQARGTSEEATEGARREAIDHLERWKSRPINFLFLARVLTRRGVWQAMQGARNVHGHTAAELERKVTAQSRETGTTADVGDLWDADEAHRALSYSTTDWKVTDAEASRVFEMLLKAEPRARGELVKQLHRMGRLGALCEHLPWGLVKQLWESIQDPAASKLLEPYWTDKGGGKSLGKRLEEQDHWYTDALDKFLDIATLGAKPRLDASYDAREAGLITNDAYWGSVTKAVGRAAFVAAATAATGGVAGELVGGASEGMGLASSGLGRGVTAVASGATAGGVGNVAGHFIGDVYDQAVDGKQGFDSLSAYGGSFKQGVIVGGMTAAVGLAASKYLPQGARSLAQEAAAARPQLTRVLEAARSVGVGAGVKVQLTIDKVIELFGGPGGPPHGFRFAYAGAGGVIPNRLASAPSTTPVWVTVRPLTDLNAPRPMQMAGGGDDLVEIEGIKLESGSIFDSYGEDASYSDDIADTRTEDTGDHVEEVVEDIGTAEPEHGGRLRGRVRSVRGRELDPRMASERGMSVLDEGRLGITRAPRHHLLPQEELEFFQQRGFAGRDIDNYTVELDAIDHEMVHGGNQPLARKHWPGREWNTKLMKTLRDREKALGRRLNRSEILAVMEVQRVEFNIAAQPLVCYDESTR
jgi:hypothetical protein